MRNIIIIVIILVHIIVVVVVVMYLDERGLVAGPSRREAGITLSTFIMIGVDLGCLALNWDGKAAASLRGRSGGQLTGAPRRSRRDRCW
jgi:hypothetical protein